MRLIDADALLDAVQGAIDIMTEHGVNMMAASVPMAIIKGTPTIDAIPVDWMLQRMNETASGAGLDVDLNNSLFRVGVEWERWKKEYAAD